MGFASKLAALFSPSCRLFLEAACSAARSRKPGLPGLVQPMLRAPVTCASMSLEGLQEVSFDLISHAIQSHPCNQDDAQPPEFLNLHAVHSTVLCGVSALLATICSSSPLPVSDVAETFSPQLPRSLLSLGGYFWSRKAESRTTARESRTRSSPSLRV